MKKILITNLMVLLVSIGTTHAQQIPLFNSYSLNQFLINPSYAGVNGKTNIFGINRVQYSGFDGAPVTYMFTADAGFKDKKFGLGGALFSDRNNLLAQNGFQMTYAYNLKLNNQWNLGMGFNAGLVQWTLNFDQLRVDDVSEEVISKYRANATTFRSDFGLHINSEKIDFGISIPQIVASKTKYSDAVKNSDGAYTSIPHLVANVSYTHALNEAMKIKPMVVVRGAKDIKPQIDVFGLFDWKDKAYASVGYRTNYAVSIGGGVHLGRGVTFGYAFDRPINSISTYVAGSHEFVVGIRLGQRNEEEKPDKPANGITKEAEAKLKADMEKQIQDKLSADLETKLKQELDARVNKAVEEKVAKAMEKMPTTPTTTTDGKTTPSASPSASVSKEDLEKIKKDIEEKIRKQMDENYAKLIDEKIKKAIDSKPVVTESAPQPSKEELEKQRKESEEKIRKEVEEKLRKELSDKVNKAVEERMLIETKKAKDEAAAKEPKELKLSAKDKATLDSLKLKNAENDKRIADLEKQLKSFPENDRIENKQLVEIKRVAHQNDIELKAFRAENKTILDAAADAPTKKEGSEEPSKFVLVLAAFKTTKEAQEFQKVAAQTFEFPNCKIIKPAQADGWYFVYQKTYDKKKKAWEAHTKLTESEFNTPIFPWIYVLE